MRGFLSPKQPRAAKPRSISAHVPGSGAVATRSIESSTLWLAAVKVMEYSLASEVNAKGKSPFNRGPTVELAPAGKLTPLSRKPREGGFGFQNALSVVGPGAPARVPTEKVDAVLTAV